MQRIEGIFSGTLSYIFNSFGPGRSFSSAVAEAKEAGFTEPDPRDDLSGDWLTSPVVQPLENRLHRGHHTYVRCTISNQQCLHKHIREKRPLTAKWHPESSKTRIGDEVVYARQALHRSYAGTDVARKVVILARECGLQLELSDVEVQSLVPSQLRDAQTPEAFLSGLAQVGGGQLM